MPPCEALREALTVSESMCKAGQEGDWEQFRDASQRRDRVLRSVLSSHRRPAPALHGLLEALSRFDAKLLALAQSQRLHCETRILDSAKARKASNAYAGVRRLNRPHPSKF